VGAKHLSCCRSDSAAAGLVLIRPCDREMATLSGDRESAITCRDIALALANSGCRGVLLLWLFLSAGV
jgi:hypothetical protein